VRPQTPPEHPLSSVEDLVAHFRASVTPPQRRRVGSEQEKIGLCRATLAPIGYEDGGVRELLERHLDRGWSGIYDGDHIIALERGETLITLEPGAQLELSGAPLESIHDFADELRLHLDELLDLSEPMGITWIALGYHPVAFLDDLSWVPKLRYHVMRPYLIQKGARAHEMMKLTATVQANYDFASEEEAVLMMRAAMGVTSIVTALFANSPLRAGREGYVSARAAAWLETDPDRCGLLPFVFDPGFSFRRYVEWALDVPMFFVKRCSQYLPAGGASFRRFLAEGLHGHHATQADWETHLTTLFPEVRFKHYVEVRGADSGPNWLTLAVPALWKGLLYDADALRATDALTRGWTMAEREQLRREVPTAGLRARVGARVILDLGREILAIAREGLRRQGRRDAAGRDEAQYLDPIDELAADGRCPADLVLDAWRAGGLPALVERFRFRASAPLYSAAR